MHLQTPLSSREIALDLLSSMRPALLGDSPFAAELEVSTSCIGWYLTAPDFSRHALAEHPFGATSATPTMRVLHAELDSFPEHDDAALALTRVLRSFQLDDGELQALAESAEQALLARGARAPAWTQQLDAWELTEAWQVSEGDRAERPGRRLSLVLGWHHPCGEEHCLIVTSNPSQFSDIDSIAVDPSIRDVIRDLRQGIEELGPAAPIVLERMANAHVGDPLDRSISKTYLHGLRPIRSDLHSLALLALVEARVQLLPPQ